MSDASESDSVQSAAPGKGVAGPRKRTRRKSVLQRAQILKATFRVVARETISGTRMPLIANEAGVSQGMLHYYFESKQHLLLEMLKWLLNEYRNQRGVTSGESVPFPAWGGDPIAALDAQLAYEELLISREPDMTKVFYDFVVQAFGDNTAFGEAIQAQFSGYREFVRTELLPPKVANTKLGPVVASVAVSLISHLEIQAMVDTGAVDRKAYLALVRKLITTILRDPDWLEEALSDFRAHRRRELREQHANDPAVLEDAGPTQGDRDEPKVP